MLGALAVAGALGASACGGGEAADPARSTPARTAPAETVGTIATESTAEPTDDLGEVLTVAADADGTVTLKASAPPVDIRVKLLEVVDPAPATEAFSPQRDNRFVAVRLALTNLGESTYTDSPTSGARLVDADGREYPAAVVHAVEPALERVTIGADEDVSGFMTFELPAGARAVSLRVRLNSGFGPEAGVWSLR